MFRDNYLLKQLGKKFVNFYYTHSKIVEIIRKNETLRTSVRVALYGPIAYADTLKNHPIKTLFLSFLMMLLFPIVSVSFLYKKRALEALFLSINPHIAFYVYRS